MTKFTQSLICLIFIMGIIQVFHVKCRQGNCDQPTMKWYSNDQGFTWHIKCVEKKSTQMDQLTPQNKVYIYKMAISHKHYMTCFYSFQSRPFLWFMGWWCNHYFKHWLHCWSIMMSSLVLTHQCIEWLSNLSIQWLSNLSIQWLGILSMFVKKKKLHCIVEKKYGWKKRS